MHSVAIATVLECDPITQTWESRVIDLLAPNVTLPETCYIFLEAGSWYKKHCSEADRKKLLVPFEAPDFLSTKTCTDLNGYFGSRTSFAPEGSDETRVRSLSTWFRILTKKVLKPEEGRADESKDYLWNEMGFFTRWSNSYACRVLCIDTPLELRLDLKSLLTAQLPSSFELRDPFAMIRPLLDQVIKLCDENTWRATKSVRGVELNRGQRPDFQRLRDLARHTGHIVEVEQVAVETIEQIASRQESIFRELADILPETYRTQANEYLAFQLQAMKSLQWRSRSTHERLAEEINLAYNMLASSDNVIMKSITLLTMIFLPATFISAFFSTTFFSFEENGWRVSNQFWIYWVVTIPFTIVVVLAWWGWMGGSNTAIRSRWLSDPKGKGAQTA